VAGMQARPRVWASNCILVRIKPAPIFSGQALSWREVRSLIRHACLTASGFKCAPGGYLQT
jgi:hypothetical protein